MSTSPLPGEHGLPDEHGGDIVVMHERVARLEPHGHASHTEHGLTFLVDGWIELECGGPMRLQAGSMMLLPAGVPHRDLAGEHVEYWLAGFCAPCLRLDESQHLMQPYRRVRRGAFPAVPIPAERRERVVGLFTDLREETARGAPESPELARSLLLLLLGEIRRAMPGPTPDIVGESLVGGALAFIQRHAFDPISLSDVAAAVHRTPTHVAAMVKKATGHPVGAWIRAARVAEAAARLQHTDDGMDAIAARVGWRDTTHFIRQFRKVHGQTPAAWRKAHRVGHRSAEGSGAATADDPNRHGVD